MFRKKITLLLLPVILLTGIVVSCKKYKDSPGPTDPRLNRPYCNDPAAVNYNWNFPGTPDNSTCFYPSDVFKGDYDYYDSIYDATDKFITQFTFPITINAQGQTKMTVSGLCSSGSFSFTASRRLRADADSNMAAGVLFCRPLDTLTGYILRQDMSVTDLQFSLTVTSDTGVFFHRGRAVKK